MQARSLSMLLVLSFPVFGCSDDGETQAAGGAAGSAGQAGAAPFALTSSAFSEGETIPTRHTCTAGGGDNVSPPLSWTAGPSETHSYAVILRDRDFQNGFLHWVIWDIPGDVLALPENVEAVFEPSQPAGAKQAPSIGVVGYVGPCSPATVNTYEFTVYAISAETLPGLDSTSTNQQAEAAIQAAAVDSATLSGES